MCSFSVLFLKQSLGKDKDRGSGDTQLEVGVCNEGSHSISAQALANIMSRGQELNKLFLSNSSGTPDTHTELSDHHSSRGRPPPHQKISGPKSFGLCRFSCNVSSRSASTCDMLLWRSMSAMAKITFTRKIRLSFFRYSDRRLGK